MQNTERTNSKVRPLKFNDEMLKALLEGRKTQTRRPVKGFEVFEFVESGMAAGMWRVHRPSYEDVPELDDNDNVVRVSPAGTFERLLVVPKYIDRECPYTRGNWAINACNKDGIPIFSISVRVTVERLQDISEQDAIAEGLERYNDDGIVYYGPYDHGDCRPEVVYRDLWKSIFGADSWDANPWIWKIEFERLAKDGGQ